MFRQTILSVCLAGLQLIHMENVQKCVRKSIQTLQLTVFNLFVPFKIESTVPEVPPHCAITNKAALTYQQTQDNYSCCERYLLK